MSKESNKRQAMTLLQDRSKRDTLIIRLVKMDVADAGNGARPDEATALSPEPPATDSPSDPQASRRADDRVSSQQPSTRDVQRLLQERLHSAYVSHALAGLLPCRRSAFAKRALDLTLGVFLAALALALIIMLALAVRLGLAKKRRQPDEPIFTRQQYVGRGGRLFSGANIPALHATRLRRFAALPLIFNVMRGEMSLVGPRPIPYAALVTGGALTAAAPSLAVSQSLARYYAKPGLTGPWLTRRRKKPSQPMGSDAEITVADPIDCPTGSDPDLAYVAHGSFGRDLILLLRTPLALIG